MKQSINKKEEQPKFKFKKCNQCSRKRNYLNEFNECNECEKCKRCYNQKRNYLSGFQFCNSCCMQIEQMTPKGFKPNLKFEKCKGINCFGMTANYLNEFNECKLCEKCKRCYNQRRDYLNKFQFCKSCCMQMEQMTPNGLKPNFKLEKCKGINCFGMTASYLNEFNECKSCEKCIKCKNKRRDYLNEFQFCNSCCNQMEEKTPSGFKPNFKLEKCKRCYQKSDYLNEFSECESCEKCKRCNNQRKDYLGGYQICNSCCMQIEQMTPKGFKPNFKLEKCKGIHCFGMTANYLNEFNECEKCEKCEKCKTQRRNYLNEFNECESCEKCKRCKNQRRDYLGGYQICNPCLKQMEQMTPSGFKPNFEFENCKKCNKKRDCLNEFQFCSSCCQQMEKMAPSGFKPNFRFEYCKKCYQIRDYLNEFNACSLCKCKRCNKNYLSEYQICNSCYKEMKQMTTSWFKVNIKFEKCKGCYREKDYLNEFLVCNSCHKQTFISSGNGIIDDFIKSCTHGKMEFVPYDDFKDVIFIARGGFSKIHKATWIGGPIIKWNEEENKYDRNNEMMVALKELDNSKNINYRELNELKIYYNLVLKENKLSVNTYYGITQDPNTQNFMIITDYHESGDLTHYITNDFFNISWYDKLHKLLGIINGLKSIHNADVIHKDYHSGNIFIGFVVMTGDLGISKSSLESLEDDNNDIYGIIPYVAPEIFLRQKYTKSSDIYSFGMIMWELLTGRRPFWDQNHDANLIIKIIDGYRPPIITNAPKGYIEVMQECWYPDPMKRPTATELYEKIVKIHINESNKIYKNPTRIVKSLDIGPTKNNLGAIYKSRLLSGMIKSAESTRNLSKIVTSDFGSLYNNNKRNFDDNQKDNNDNDKINKRIKQDEHDDYVTIELELDININASEFND